MSDTSGLNLSGASPAPANSLRAPNIAGPTSPMVAPGRSPYPPPAGDNHTLLGVRPVAGQPLSNEPVQMLSNEPVLAAYPTAVHSLSSEIANRGSTEGGQTLDSHDAQTPSIPFGQGVNTHSEHGVDKVNEQSMSSPCEQAPDSQFPSSKPLFILRQEITHWTANQDKVLSFFRSCGHCVTNHKVVGEKLGIPYGTVRNIIRRLVGAGYLRTEAYKNATIQGVEVWYCGPDPLPPGDNQAIEPQLHMPGVKQPLNMQVGQPDWTEAERLAHIEEGKIEREKSIYLE